jgi:hypothetical protein
MQDGNESDFGAEVFGIGGNGPERLDRDLEQHRIDQGFVVVSDRGYWLRHCEHDMEVLDRQ